ncbi:glycosyltransferase family 2 protein [Mesobacillus foraminis]|uniref:Glycosyltransferase involved in cell wall biosynthesis n=1 Tax=Mesobacillus foraminis TaxID=279826 RepID=A0A4R2B612_9BACI|nr:glycosyltransferase family 2 protein [Mesobacillus foraminis]TCN22197.1 glycosyltransferase involved in cell wall biosynthesis [Mesobacillus foraminis]
MDKFKVSIIVPVFNCEQYISNCLESIVSQTHRNIEIILVNDGSSDNSESIIKKFMEKDKRIVYFYQENSGPSAARNTGITNSNGKYLVFVDSDDTIDNSYVESLLKAIVATRSDIVCCGYKDISEYGIVNYTDFKVEKGDSLSAYIKMASHGTGGVLWSKIYKKDIIETNNLRMNKKLFMSEDLIFVLQYLTYCKNFNAIPQYLYNYNRLNQKSISCNISIDYMDNYVKVWEEIITTLKPLSLKDFNLEKLITKKVQEFVLNIVESQSKNLHTIGINTSVNNINKVLSKRFIQRYVKEFNSNNLINKPYVFFLKNKLIKLSIVYGVILTFLKSLRRKWKIKRLGAYEKKVINSY